MKLKKRGKNKRAVKTRIMGEKQFRVRETKRINAQRWGDKGMGGGVERGETMEEPSCWEN